MYSSPVRIPYPSARKESGSKPGITFPILKRMPLLVAKIVPHVPFLFLTPPSELIVIVVLLCRAWMSSSTSIGSICCSSCVSHSESISNGSTGFGGTVV